MDQISRLAKYIMNAQNIVVLTGAGISTESGIPDFRSEGGAWNNNNKASMMRGSHFNYRPKLFWPVFKEVFCAKMGQNVEPNAGHTFLTDLESMGKNVSVFTQNVDGLHQRAGSSKVYEMHGNAQTAYCPKHKALYGLEHIMSSDVPRCTHTKANGDVCGFILKPSVVLFEERIHHYYDAQDAIAEADLLLVLGTSLEVSPVNEIPAMRSVKPMKRVLITRSVTPKDHLFDLVLHAGIGEVLGAVISGCEIGST